MVVRKCDLIYPDLASSSFEAVDGATVDGRPHQMLADASRRRRLDWISCLEAGCVDTYIGGVHV